MVASILKIYFKTLIFIFVCANILHLTPRVAALSLVVKEIEISKACNNTNTLNRTTTLLSSDQKAFEFKIQLLDIKIEQLHPPPELVDIVPGIIINVPKDNVRFVGHIKIVNTQIIHILSIEAYEGNTKAFERAIQPTSTQPSDNGYILYTFDQRTNLPAGRKFRITKVLFTVITDNVSITQTLTNFLSPIIIDVAE